MSKQMVFTVVQWNFRECSNAIQREDVNFLSSSPRKDRYTRRLSDPDLLCEFCKLPLMQSPELRRGPSGKNSLCNKCGLQYKREVEHCERVRKIMKIDHVLNPRM